MVFIKAGSYYKRVTDFRKKIIDLEDGKKH